MEWMGYFFEGDVNSCEKQLNYNLPQQQRQGRPRGWKAVEMEIDFLTDYY
jgi:hypothetical protein